MSNNRRTRGFSRVCQGVTLAILLSANPAQAPAQNNKPAKPRIVITADPELDDLDTLIRAILYFQDFQIEGLIYNSSMWHWKGDGKGTTQYIAGREYTRPGGQCGPCT